jgi:hypothetical protein
MADLPFPRHFIVRSEPIPAPQWADLVAVQPDFAWWTRVEAGAVRPQVDRLPAGRLLDRSPLRDTDSVFPGRI